MRKSKKFYEKIECEHGWTDDNGFAHCELGTSCSIGLECFCVKEVCPIYNEDQEMENDEIGDLLYVSDL